MLIQLASNFPDEARRIVFRVVQTNGFHAHPENILISKINDEDAEIRELGWRRKKKTRQAAPQKPNRVFEVPKINFEATYDLIDWRSTKLTEPPLTKRISLEEIDMNIKTKAKAGEEMRCFPCHTQQVKRMIRIVAASTVAATPGTNSSGLN